jgi:hypothetical protein
MCRYSKVRLKIKHYRYYVSNANLIRFLKTKFKLEFKIYIAEKFGRLLAFDMKTLAYV